MRTVFVNDQAQQSGVIALPPHESSTKSIFFALVPGGADGIIVVLPSFVGGIPALHNLIRREALRRGIAVAPEPLALDQVASFKHRRLLVLRLEAGATLRPPELLQRLARLVLRMQHF